MDTITKILFRLVLAYTVLAVPTILTAVLVNDPLWDRGYAEPKPGPGAMLSLRRAGCDRIEAADARRKADELSNSVPSDSIAAPFDRARTLRRNRECLAYYEQLAEWHQRATPNWRSSPYWQMIAGALALFVVPAWLLWATVRWAILAPLRREGA